MVRWTTVEYGDKRYKKKACPKCGGSLLPTLDDSRHKLVLQCINCGYVKQPEKKFDKIREKRRKFEPVQLQPEENEAENSENKTV